MTDIPWRNSIFTRLVITFLLVLTPLYFFGIQIFNWSRNMMTEQIYNTMQAQVNMNLNYLENEVMQIRKNQIDCYIDDDLNLLANASEFISSYEKVKAVMRVRQRLTIIQDSSIYIQHASAIIPALNLRINAAGAGKSSIEDMNDETIKILENIPMDSPSQIMYWNDRIILEETFTAGSKIKKMPPFIIEVEVSKSAIKNALIKSDTSIGARSILEIPTQNYSVFSYENQQSTSQFLKIIAEYREDKKSGTISIEIDDKKYLLIYTTSDYLGATISRYIPEDLVFQQLEKYKTWYLAFSILAIIIIVSYSFFTYKFIQKPLFILIKSFRKVESGNFDIKIIHKNNDEFNHLYNRFNEMVNNVKILIEQVYKQKILAQKAELKQLQSQINPHFLYNSFFILQRRISKGDYINAEKFCEGLGIYFKYITRSSSDNVSLKKEVEHAKIYSDIQATRFSNRIKVDFENVPSKYEDLLVPRLILQPIIENAFEHGLEEKENDGYLRISFAEIQNMLKICIEDNGDNLKDSDLEELEAALNNDDENIENTGIININKRLHLYLGVGSGIRVFRSELGGLKVEIHLVIQSI